MATSFEEIARKIKTGKKNYLYNKTLVKIPL
jgi:hypothetical protein